MRTGPRSLRSRLTLLVATAVAAAIAVCAGACWFLVRSELLDQVDRSLRSPKGPQGVEWIERYCSGAEPDRPPPPRLALLQLVDAAGRTCAVGTEVEVVPGDRELARAPRGTEAFRDGTTSDGDEVRVLVQSVGGGLVLMESRPLEEFRSTLTALAGILAGVAALGVVGAATAGRLIARTALRPVERLTGAVEHVARTEDLGTRIPVEGTDELARLGASFNAMTAALAGSRERQRRLIADAGHELRTPLTSLRTNIDLLLRSEDSGRPLEPAPKRRLLTGLKAQFEEMSTLVGALLQLSRGDSEHAPRVEVAFHEVVGAAVGRARLRARDLPIETDLGPWYVHADPAALERAVVNLLDNAVKFSADPGPGDGPGGAGPGGPGGSDDLGGLDSAGGPDGPGGGARGPVVVRLRDGELTVRDHGPGIGREELPYVFDRFWRSPSARSMPGSGLGLAIVAQAVREAGGEVALENADGGGTVARLRLPGSPVAGGGD
ncbi:HAMP domain-containing histidine kinase [Planomonospora sp. ID91781]|uniref:HAMP domain-containing sensor histidine kinase n=1 Tax=Planomonospora sp. ID91781 TaxID=2738135 RepID=UPI0018C3E1CF|nr:HAMP domain-containing sensor histidine kinase [Planomonospora sp. ID91781]MBG0824204.1 HAMP domain-containing histidine kinase [Planomonospora sp. ID91781]